MKNQQQSNSKIKGKNIMLVSLFIGLFYKEKYRGKKKRKQFFQKITCPNQSLNQNKFNHNLDKKKKNYYKKNTTTTAGKAFKCFLSSTLLALQIHTKDISKREANVGNRASIRMKVLSLSLQKIAYDWIKKNIRKKKEKEKDCICLYKKYQ